MPKGKKDPEDRFFALVERTESCWLWAGATNGHPKLPYPQFWDGTRSVYAHRWAYAHWVGPIPEGQQVDHVRERGCTSSLCVNPAHLEAVPQAVNLDRSRPDPIEFCKRGHPQTEENTRRDRQGRRKGCRVCHRLWLQIRDLDTTAIRE